MEFTNVYRRSPSRPYTLKEINKLPEGLFELAGKHLPDNQEVEGIFVIPPDSIPKSSRKRKISLEALIFTPKGVLHLAEPDKHGVGGSGIWLVRSDILMTKLSLILLYAKLEIWGVKQGQVVKIEAEYNTVSHPLLVPFLRNLIRSTWESRPPGEGSRLQSENLAELEKISYSLYNGLVNEAIQPGENILGYLHQPELRMPWMKVFHKKVFPQTVIARTDQQIILLQEDLKYKTHHEWIFTFIPLSRISRLEREEFPDWTKIIIHLLPEGTGQTVDLLLDSRNAEKLLAICQDKTEGFSR